MAYAQKVTAVWRTVPMPSASILRSTPPIVSMFQFKEPDVNMLIPLVDKCRRTEPGELLEAHNDALVSYIKLRDGGADYADFELVYVLLKTATVRAEQIGEQSLIETIDKATRAMERAQVRRNAGKAYGFDADGLQALPLALDAWEAIADASSKAQRASAIREAYKRLGVKKSI